MNIDKRGKRNLEELAIAVSMAKETASKKDIYKTDVTQSGIDKEPNDEQHRQMDLNDIDTYKGKKTSGILVRRIYKKYHVIRYHDFVKKLQKIIKKRPEAAVPYSDFIRDLPPHFIVTFSKPEGKHRLPTIGVTKGIPKKTFNKMIKDFSTSLKKLLSKKDYEEMMKPV